MTLSRSVRSLMAVAGVVAALAASPAHADLLWQWGYTGSGIDASGTFSTTDTADASGFYEILAITGTRNGVAITGLEPTGTAIPGNEPFAVDNLVGLGANGQLTVEGFGYALASGAFANPYFADFLSPPAYSEVLTQDGSFSEVPIVFTAQQVPEPSTLALAVGALWVAGRVRRRRAQPSAARPALVGLPTAR